MEGGFGCVTGGGGFVVEGGGFSVVRGASVVGMVVVVGGHGDGHCAGHGCGTGQFGGMTQGTHGFWVDVGGGGDGAVVEFVVDVLIGGAADVDVVVGGGVDVTVVPGNAVVARVVATGGHGAGHCVGHGCGTGQFGGMTQGTHGCLVVGNGVGLLVAIVP